MRTALPLAFLISTTAGCVHEGAGDLASADDYATNTPPSAPVALHDVVVPRDAQETPDVVVRAPEAPQPQRARRDPIFFHLGAGYGALGQVDLGPCRDQGLQPGYLRMRVTFRDDGHVAHAAVESNAPPPGDALNCIAQQLKSALVPAFDGEDVVLSKGFFVN
jgi:hypothetical protein